MRAEGSEAEQLELIPRKTLHLNLVSFEGEQGKKGLSGNAGRFLSRGQFLNCLRLEKRRAERSGASLSIIFFSIYIEAARQAERMNDFFGYIHNITRETDIKGVIAEDVIALILPDTDRKGAQSCIRKLIHNNGKIPYTVVSATYPEELFKKILDEAENQPDLFPLNVDEEIKHFGAQMLFKRGMDILGALVGLIIFSPVFLIIALAIKISSPGPIIFKQARLGKQGVKFNFYKFRSMFINNDDKTHREYYANLIKGEVSVINQGESRKPLFKMKNDTRVTKVGKIIRKLSLDELPQFFNVLRGEMSLIGPRPPLLYEVEKYEPWHLRRVLEMKPGISGLWQVGGRGRTTFDEMVRLDLRYVRNWTMWLDIKIIFKTFIEIFRISDTA